MRRRIHRSHMVNLFRAFDSKWPPSQYNELFHTDYVALGLKCSELGFRSNINRDQPQQSV